MKCIGLTSHDICNALGLQFVHDTTLDSSSKFNPNMKILVLYSVESWICTISVFYSVYMYVVDEGLQN